MAYGDGGNWMGTAKVTGTGHLQVVIWETSFVGSSASVSFPITDGQSAKTVAENLMNAWNAACPNEATLDRDYPSIVRFEKNRKGPTAMAVTGASGERKPLSKGTAQEVVDGLEVTNVGN